MKCGDVKVKKKVLIFILLLLICVLYFHDILTGHYIFTERDLAVFFIPPRILWSGMIKNRQVPLWNPYCYCGQPFFASLQPGMLYPLNILLLIMPFDCAFNAIIILHFLLAGWFTYMLIKALDGTDTGALLGAITFMLSGYLLSIHNLLIHLLSITWLPLILLSYYKYIKKAEIKYTIYASIFLTLMFLGGAVEIVYGTFLLLCALILFKDPFGTGAHSVSFRQKTAFLALTGACFICLSAVQLIPFLEMAFHSIRSGGLTYKEAIIWSLSPKDLLQFFLPDLYGSTLTSQKYWQHQNWLKTIYMGCIPFALSLFFILEKKRKALPPLLIMALSILLALGGYTALYPILFRYIPFLNTIRYPVKFLFLFIFFLSVMAGIGYNSFCRLNEKKSKAAGTMVYGLIIVSIITALLWSFMTVYHHPIKAFLELKGFIPPHYNDISINMHNMKRFLLFCSLLGPTLIFGWGHPRKRALFFTLIMALLSADLFCANKGFYDKYEAESFHRPSEAINFLKKDLNLFRIITAPKTVHASVGSQGLCQDQVKVYKERVMPGFNLEPRISSIEGSEVIRLTYYNRILGLIMTAPRTDSTNLLSLCNVKYILSRYDLDSDELELAKNISEDDMAQGALKIYQNKSVYPRAFLVGDYRIVTEEKEYKRILERKNFNPYELVLLDRDPWAEKSPIGTKTMLPSYNKKENVTITEYQPNRVEIEVAVGKPKLLFLSDSYYPGWKVYIDGVKDTIYRANYAFRAVALAPGTHTIEFVYQPMSFIIGAFMTLLTLILAIGVLAGRKNFLIKLNASAAMEG